MSCYETQTRKQQRPTLIHCYRGLLLLGIVGSVVVVYIACDTL
jgi:hypothetical protein